MFFECFKKYRKRARLSQRRMAELLGIKDPKSVRAWEQGKYVPNEENVYKIINIFFEWGVMDSVEDAKKLWELAFENRKDAKGFEYEFDITRLKPSMESTPSQKIRLIGKPELSNINLSPGELVTAKFSLTSLSEKTIFIKEIALCCRLGSTWSGIWADFPHVKNVVLKPDGEFHYEEVRRFDTPGKYFGECVALINDRWDGIAQDDSPRYPRVFFYVGLDLEPVGNFEK